MTEFNVQELLSSIEKLKEELQVEKSRRLALEEECDLLADENVRLREQVENNGSTEKPIQVVAIKYDVKSTWDDILIEGNGSFAKTILCRIDDACNSQNLTCSTFCNTNSALGVIITIAVVGGTDKCVHGYNIQTREELFSLQFDAPILILMAFGTKVACGMMDGSHAVFDVENTENLSVQRFKDHSKYINCMAWSPDGKYLATISSDKTLNLYTSSGSDVTLQKLSTIHFSTTPECLLFAPKSSNGNGDQVSTQSHSKAAAISLHLDSEFKATATVEKISDSDSGLGKGFSKEADEPYELIVGLRDTHYLLYLSCRSLSQRRVSLNERDWDTHVSFTPLYLSLSPNRKYLLVATDKHTHYIFLLGTNTRVRTLSGHGSGEYAKPRAVWDPSGSYVYSNSEADHAIHVYSVASERVVHVIPAHRGKVRDLAVSSSGLLLAASFDHSFSIHTL